MIGWLVACRAPSVLALSVEPTVVELRGATHTQMRGVFHVVNDTDAPVTVSVELESLSATGYASRRPEEWVQISPATLQLAPQQRAEVTYVVFVPPQTAGELAAEVAFVQHLSHGGSGGMEIRFGSALYVSIAGTERLQVSVGPMSLQTGATPSVRIPLTNDGNVHCRPEGSVSVIGQQDQILARGTLTRGMPAPPGRVEPFTVWLHDVWLPPGTYRLAVDLTCHATAEPPVHLAVEQAGRLNDTGQWIPNPASTSQGL